MIIEAFFTTVALIAIAAYFYFWLDKICDWIPLKNKILVSIPMICMLFGIILWILTTSNG